MVLSKGPLIIALTGLFISQRSDYHEEFFSARYVWSTKFRYALDCFIHFLESADAKGHSVSHGFMINTNKGITIFGAENQECLISKVYLVNRLILFPLLKDCFHLKQVLICLSSLSKQWIHQVQAFICILLFSSKSTFHRQCVEMKRFQVKWLIYLG